MSLLTVQIKANTVIFKEGAYDKMMFIVISGRVKIYLDRNEKEVELAVINPFDFFGEMALYRNRPRSACAKTMEDSKLVVIKTQVQLEQFIAQNPAFAGKMMVIMGNRLASSNDLLLEKINELSEIKGENKPSPSNEKEPETASARVRTVHTSR